MQSWIAQHFFNPSVVLPLGAALAAVPIIIHLINRMRFRRVRFAAMEFLLQSQQRNRRRILLEQLLLLLARVAVVVALVALIGRLIVDPAEMSIFRGTKTHHLVLLDDSGSMRNRWGETTAFDEALEVVRKIAAEGAQRPGTQQFTLVTTSNPEQPVFTQRDVTERFTTELETRLETLRCTHRAVDSVAALKAAGELLAEDRAAIRQLHFLSDFREPDWTQQSALGATIDELDEDEVAVNLVRVVPERNANVAVTGLSGDTQVAAAGVPLRLTTRVQNFSDVAARDVRLAVISDGQKLPMGLSFPSIDPGAEVSREFDVIFDRPGRHRVEVSSGADALSGDNARFFAVEITDKNPVLIVDGDPYGEEASYVADAVAANPALTGVAPVIDSPDSLRKQPLQQFRAIYLLNVPELAPDAIEALASYVRDGGGVAWFLGDQVKPAFYNDKLNVEAKGLFPVPLASARKELPRADEVTPGPDVSFTAHPLFRIFEGQDNPFVESVTIDSYLPPADTWVRDDNKRADGVRTLATLRDRQPLMVESRYGDGRIVACFTSAGPMWNAWARNPSYVVFQLELTKWIARNDSKLESRVVGEAIDLSLDPAMYTESVEIAAPDATGEQLTRMTAAPQAAKEGENDVRLTASFGDTDTPGVYRVRLVDQSQAVEERWLAYNVPAAESNLAIVDEATIRKQIGDTTSVSIQAPGDFQWLEGKSAGEEVRNVLLALLAALLIAEQFLAYRLSYHPKTSTAVA